MARRRSSARRSVRSSLSSVGSPRSVSSRSSATRSPRRSRRSRERTIGPRAVSPGRPEVEPAAHVVLRYGLAGGGNRGFAALVDFVIATLIFIGAFYMFNLFAGAVGFQAASPYFGIALLLTFAVAWSYYILLEWLGNGQTLGKRMFGLRVIADDGAPAGFIAVLVRNLVCVVDFLPGFYAFGLVAIVVSPRSQRLGDLAAGTFVVRAPRPQLDYFSLRTVTPLGAGTQVEVRGLPGEAQRLVREFVAREAKLAPDHRARVAKQLADRLRPYARDLDTGLSDIELIRAIARSLRASAGDR